MSVLHMETDQVRGAARQMDEWAMRMWNRERDLRATSGMLSLAWRGDRADRFLQQFRAWLGRYQTQVEELQSLALRLLREVEEWELAAASGVRTWQEIPPPPIPPALLPFDWTKVRDKGTELVLFLLNRIPYDSVRKVDYKDIGRFLNKLLGNKKAGFVGFMDRFGHLAKSPIIQDGIPLGLGIWADYRQKHDWKHALGSELIEFGIDMGIMAIPHVGQIYMGYKVGLAVGHLAAGALELVGYHDEAVQFQNFLDTVDFSERLGDAIYDFIAHPPKISLDPEVVAQAKACFSCGFE